MNVLAVSVDDISLDAVSAMFTIKLKNATAMSNNFLRI